MPAPAAARGADDLSRSSGASPARAARSSFITSRITPTTVRTTGRSSDERQSAACGSGSLNSDSGTIVVPRGAIPVASRKMIVHPCPASTAAPTANTLSNSRCDAGATPMRANSAAISRRMSYTRSERHVKNVSPTSSASDTSAREARG